MKDRIISGLKEGLGIMAVAAVILGLSVWLTWWILWTLLAIYGVWVVFFVAKAFLSRPWNL